MEFGATTQETILIMLTESHFSTAEKRLLRILTNHPACPGVILTHACITEVYICFWGLLLLLISSHYYLLEFIPP